MNSRVTFRTACQIVSQSSSVSRFANRFRFAFIYFFDALNSAVANGDIVEDNRVGHLGDNGGNGAVEKAWTNIATLQALGGAY